MDKLALHQVRVKLTFHDGPGRLIQRAVAQEWSIAEAETWVSLGYICICAAATSQTPLGYTASYLSGSRYSCSLLSRFNIMSVKDALWSFYYALDCAYDMGVDPEPGPRIS